MAIHDLLLTELEAEAKKTRTSLSRVPEGKADFAPHAKSKPLGKLAAHIARISGYGAIMVAAPELDLSSPTIPAVPFESVAQVLAVFDAGIAKSQKALASAADSAWSEPWKFLVGDHLIFEGTRFGGYRTMFVNHMVHHRAQLGVYLRLLDQPVPSIYGPSADEK